MAKALLGSMGGTDPRIAGRLAAENRRLRERVADLEAMVLRLQMENDTLASRERTLASRGKKSMQPV